MKITRYSEPQILAILRQGEGGVPVSELCREHRMINASFYKWCIFSCVLGLIQLRLECFEGTPLVFYFSRRDVV